MAPPAGTGHRRAGLTDRAAGAPYYCPGQPITKQQSRAAAPQQRPRAPAQLRHHLGAQQLHQLDPWQPWRRPRGPGRGSRNRWPKPGDRSRSGSSLRTGHRPCALEGRVAESRAMGRAGAPGHLSPGRQCGRLPAPHPRATGLPTARPDPWHHRPGGAGIAALRHCHHQHRGRGPGD